MLRNQLVAWSTLATTLFLAGCNSCNTCGGGLFSNSDRPPLFSRFRTTSSVVVSDGGCCNGCNGPVTGPFVPPVGQPGLPPFPPPGAISMPPGAPFPVQPGAPIPATPGVVPGAPPAPPLTPQPNPPIPRIEENVSPQNPWDPKAASRQGTPTHGGQVVPKN